MSYQPEFSIAPLLLDRVEQITSLRERITGQTCSMLM